jgi:hypothetical protein
LITEEDLVVNKSYAELADFIAGLKIKARRLLAPASGG